MSFYFDALILIAAPSGTGKTSIVKHLLEVFPQLSFSVSATTRNPRKGEVNGKDYHFLSEETFRKKIKEGAFIEWEMVYQGRYYGTLYEELQQIWAKQRIPLLEIDIKGAINIITTASCKKNLLSIFLCPPSLEHLRMRLNNRATEDASEIEDRIKKADYELTLCSSSFFNEIIINDDWEQCKEEVTRKVRAYLTAASIRTENTPPYNIDSK